MAPAEHLPPPRLDLVTSRPREKKSRRVRFHPPSATCAWAREKASRTGAPRKKSSRSFSFHAGGFEGRHLAHDSYGRFDQAHEQTGAGALAETHLQIQDGQKLQLVEHQPMASFGGKVRGEENSLHMGAKSLREQRSGAGDETIQHHRQAKRRRA